MQQLAMRACSPPPPHSCAPLHTPKIYLQSIFTELQEFIASNMVLCECKDGIESNDPNLLIQFPSGSLGPLLARCTLDGVTLHADRPTGCPKRRWNMKWREHPAAASYGPQPLGGGDKAAGKKKAEVRDHAACLSKATQKALKFKRSDDLRDLLKQLGMFLCTRPADDGWHVAPLYHFSRLVQPTTATCLSFLSMIDRHEG